LQRHQTHYWHAWRRRIGRGEEVRRGGKKSKERREIKRGG
jgi:hypothetical protein